MDIEKLIKRLKCPQIQSCPMDGEYPSCKVCQKDLRQEVITEFSTLQAENTQLKEKLEALKQDRDAIEQDFRAFAKQWWEQDSGFPCCWRKFEKSGGCEWKVKHPGEICAGRAFEWFGQKED